MIDFELNLDAVRDILRSETSFFLDVKISERQVNSFTVFRVDGPDGTASLELVVNPEVRHFEFCVGMYIVYEGDYRQYPPELNFVRELIHAVTRARVSECRYKFWGWPFNRVAKVDGCVMFESYRPYRVSRALSWLYPFAQLRNHVSYAEYKSA